MSRQKKTAQHDLAIPTLPEDAIRERDAAAAWLYALKFEPEQDQELLYAMLTEFFNGIDISRVHSLVCHRNAYENISADFAEEILEQLKVDKYEDLAYRNAVMHVLVEDYFTELRQTTVTYADDAVARVVKYLDEDLRGSTKNATQVLSGQRTKMRRISRELTICLMYMFLYRKDCDIYDDATYHNMGEVLAPDGEPAFLNDNFNAEDLIDRNGKMSARMKFALAEARNRASKILLLKKDIDAIIQKSSAKWRVSRMAVIDLIILELGTYEMMYEKKVPSRVVINEAVELAKVYCSEQSKGFVNGILQQICTDNEVSVK